MGKASHSPSTLSAPETRAQDETFVQQCSFAGLRSQLPLRWPTPPGIPDSPKKKYRSQYVYLGLDDLNDIFGGMLEGQSLGRIVVEL